jgi:O-antigen/teichoic acid export membrane protein
MIREAILFGGVLYVLITIAQIIDHPSIWSEGIIVAIILAIATAYYLIHDEHRLHRSEMIALWAAVLLFMVYGLLKYGGFL